jgi:hypothetical protein
VKKSILTARLAGDVDMNAIGAPGFEPGTSATQRRRATRLRYAPRKPRVYGGYGAPWQSRDPASVNVEPAAGTKRQS